jgi:hypothetical protein
MDAQVTAALITGACAIVAAAIPIIIYKRRIINQPGGSTQRPSPDSGGLTLDDIVERLERHRQRATYGAVAGLLGRQPLTLFNGYPFSPRNSWVVASGNGRPTNYHPSQFHPDLFRNSHVIRSSEELRAWLATHL